jgi:exodeoxyribonuclease V alpha subunit
MRCRKYYKIGRYIDLAKTINNGNIKEFKCVPEICTYNSPDYKIYGATVDLEKYPDIKLNKYGNVSIIGNFHELGTGIEYHVKAEEQVSKKGFGTQYKVINIRRQRPTDAHSTRQFLYEIITFNQANTLLEVYPDIVDRVVNDRLEDVDLNKTPGIKDFTFNLIKKRIIENFCLVELVDEFQGLLNISILKKLYDKYPSIQKIRTEIKEQPYKCLCGLWGVGFKTADGLILEIDRVSKEKVEAGEKAIIDFGYNIQTSPQREKACIMYLLEENENDGHTRMDIKELKSQAEKLAPSCIHHFVDVVKNDEHIYFDKTTMSASLVSTYETEGYIAQRVIDAVNNSTAWEIAHEQYKTLGEIQLTDEQGAALEYLCKYNLFILNGFGGTGKSQTTSAIIEMLKANGKSFELFSPTGRAAKVLSGFTKCNASTIHRGLGFRPPNTWTYNEECNLSCDVLVIDEFGMVDVFLFKRVLEAVDFNRTKVILIGDSAQIPSVGAGNILHDLLNSKIVPTVSLTKVFRYGEGGLMTIATKTRESENIVDEKSKEVQIFGQDKSYYFIPVDQDKAIKQMKQLYLKLLAQKYQPKDILVLTCYNKGDKGTIELNKQLQPLANDIKTKSKYTFGETSYYQDDLVMQCVNNYQAKIHPIPENKFEEPQTMLIPNGEIGVVSEILNGAIIVDFDGVKIHYDKEDISMLKLAYSISTHKSQGGQAKVVILFTPKAHSYMLNSNLMYVGQTRAKERVFHFGEANTVNWVVKKKADLDRLTFLKQLLKFQTIKT